MAFQKLNCSRQSPCRMRSSTILVITLRSLAQETIKNLVLSGVGRMIVMDDKEVTEMDLGAGLLFREDDGAVGQKVSTSIGTLFSE